MTDTDNEGITARDRRHIWHPFTQAKGAAVPIEITSASGSVLTTADGRQLLDLISSWWVNTHGHAHPHIAAAIAEQAARLEQVIFAGFTHRPAVEVASTLARLLPGELQRIFFTDNGSTAVEVALKIAIQYWRNQGIHRNRIVAFEGGYHGDTVGAMSAGSGSGFFSAFEEMMFPIELITWPETWEEDSQVEEKEQAALKQLEEYLQRNGHETAALIAEPLVQGAGGMRMCRPQFLQAVAALLKEHQVLLIFDEVMTGFGRTGELFASITAGVTPDLICLSKGLSGGYLPLAVTACSDQIYDAFLGDNFDKALAHGHSFTANPIACAAANASLELFQQAETMEQIRAIESIHRERQTTISKLPGIKQSRITGTIAAFNIETEQRGYGSRVGEELKNYFLKNGLLLRPLGNVLYLLPPYCTSSEQLHRGYDVIEQALSSLRGLKGAQF